MDGNITFKLNADNGAFSNIDIKVVEPPAQKKSIALASIAKKESAYATRVSYQKHKEIWLHYTEADFASLMLPGYYSVVPLRWTQSNNGFFKNKNGEPVSYNHYNGLGQLVLNPDFLHVIEFQVLGAAIDDVSSVQALKYWKAEQGKLLGGFVCGTEKFPKYCTGKIAKFAVKNGTFGYIALRAAFKLEANTMSAVSYARFYVDKTEGMVYVTQKGLGSTKLSGRQSWPVITDTNEYKFGTNDVFAKADNNKIRMPAVQGMPFTFQINCVGGKCAKREEWKFTVGTEDEMNQEDAVIYFKNREAQVEAKWAGLNEKYGFYVLEKLDDKDLKIKKDERVIKSVEINANPWEAAKELRFSLESRKNTAKIVKFSVIVEDWNGAPKFWVGFFTLLTIIVLQVLSCAYMAKKNTGNKQLD